MSMSALAAVSRRIWSITFSTGRLVAKSVQISGLPGGFMWKTRRSPVSWKTMAT
ncbi:MAG: hypothetical protein M5U25_15290 [Planctomycetota bacterium]|nr:hypothetical protein [Planctomycetota bacterium]